MTIDDNRPWWKEPMLWLVLGLPAIAVVGSFTSYYFAARDPDTLVKTEYRKVGLAMVEPANSAAGVAAALGLSARLTSGSGRVELVLRGHLATPPERLSLSVLHPAHENMDIHILLAHTHDSTYIAAAPDMGMGKRVLVLEPQDRSWRIAGQWTAPYAMTELGTKATHPSTHP